MECIPHETGKDNLLADQYAKHIDDYVDFECSFDVKPECGLNEGRVGVDSCLKGCNEEHMHAQSRDETADCHEHDA